MSKKIENSGIAGHWSGVGAALGACAFVLTREPIWIALGVAIGAALDWQKRKHWRDTTKTLNALRIWPE